ncbi:hypothetical protein [Dyella telluris]|uniref:Copper chaperone PCu(A)C n=1 Tax=Dyella telluris TaxID=2763498 RepID=A0A7G8Q6Y0_9GAMM|nr:hypothetical protein [Dyella telluris]QNK02538.1 hypothetical protein H8F01_05210 [Dyella telluris]
MKKTLIAAALFLSAPLAAHAACAPTDFQVQDFKMKLVGAGAAARLSLTGQLVNHCAEAAAAQITIDAKDGSGKVLATKKGWPAGTTNIAPGQSVDFDLGRLFRFDPEMQQYTVGVADVRTW